MGIPVPAPGSDPSPTPPTPGGGSLHHPRESSPEVSAPSLHRLGLTSDPGFHHDAEGRTSTWTAGSGIRRPVRPDLAAPDERLADRIPRPVVHFSSSFEPWPLLCRLCRVMARPGRTHEGEARPGRRCDRHQATQATGSRSRREGHHGIGRMALGRSLLHLGGEFLHGRPGSRPSPSQTRGCRRSHPGASFRQPAFDHGDRTALTGRQRLLRKSRPVGRGAGARRPPPGGRDRTQTAWSGSRLRRPTSVA